MADERTMKNDDNGHILYNLLVYAEWNLEGEVLNRDSLDILQKRGSLSCKFVSIIEGSIWNFWKLIKYPFRDFANHFGLPDEIIKNHKYSKIWDLSLSRNGSFLAVLQDQMIEIRSCKDNFSSVLSKCHIKKDPSAKWRKLSWSVDALLLAFSYSSGEVVVFDLSGTAVSSLKGNLTSNVSSGTLFRQSKAVAGLIFRKHDDKDDSFHELLIITYQGHLESYMINGNNGEYQKRNIFSFQSVLPCGISAVLHYPMSNLLIIGSPGVSLNDDQCAIGNGITLWRMLSGHPYYKLIENQALELKKAQKKAGLLAKLFQSRSRKIQSGVWKMSLNVDGTSLVVLHYSGHISLWDVPSLRHRQTWDRTNQPEYKTEEMDHHDFPSFNSKKYKGGVDIFPYDNFPYDIAWWSNEAIILAQSSGAVTVSSVTKSLRNILGQYAEWCEPFPLVTSAYNGGFLILECENSLVTSTNARRNMGDKEEHVEEEEERHVITKTKELARHLLYFVTESEQFRPPIRRPKILKQTYRLLSLRSTTPEELYASKIELEEYGEALALAKSYGLDCDLVYQKQWRKSKINASSIHDYLSKVTKRIWVLHECLERIPEDLDSTKALLKYGLYGTNVHVLKIMGGKNVEHPYIKDDESDEESEKEEEKRLLTNIDFKNLSVEQRNLCRYRARFLKYLNRLATYEAILGGHAFAHDAFDSHFFTSFRDNNIVETATNFARDNDWSAVDCLLTYHGKQTIPHYLAILSNFPETTSPFDYRSLLPEAGVEPTGESVVYEWEQKSWRLTDWAEELSCEIIDGDDVDNGDFLYIGNDELKQFSNISRSDDLTEWYKYRALEIERLSKQVGNALELVKLGKERGVKDLMCLHDDLMTLSDVIYESCSERYMDLESFQELNNFEKMQLLLSKSTEQSFIRDFKKWVVSFLERLESRNKGSKVKLLRQFMTETAKSDLMYPLQIMEQSCRDETLPFIPDVAQQMTLAIDCVYLCSRNDQLDQASSMLKCFNKDDDTGILSQQIIELRKKIMEVDKYLQAAQLLSKNGFSKPVSFLLDNESNKEVATSLMNALSKLAKNKQPGLTKLEWTELLNDLLTLRDQIFHCIPRTTCYQACAQSLLGSGNKEIINHCKQLLCSRSESSPDKVPYDNAVEMVVNAAKEYFNSANGVSDPSIDLAKTCLGLVPCTEPCVKEELDLIAALLMLAELKVVILPLQVRLCQDKAELIEKALDSCLSAYKNPGKLLHLASLLQLSGTDEKTRHGRVLCLVAKRAMQNGDYDVAYHACVELTKAGFISGWNICRTLGENNDFTNLNARRKLLDFSLSHCEPSAMEALLNARSLLQTQILYSEISEVMGKIDDTGDQDWAQLSKTTKTIISNVSDVGWWKNTLQWVRPLNRSTSNDTSDGNTFHSDNLQGVKPLNRSECEMEGKEEILVDFRFPAFYDIVHGQSGDKLPGNRAVLHEDTEHALCISELLLQTQKLSEERADGSIEEPGTEVLLQLAHDCFHKDSPLFLAYLLALPEFNNAYECFEKLPRCLLTLQLACYYYALQVYNELKPCVQENKSALYYYHPGDVIDHVLQYAGDNDDVRFLLVHLKRYHNQLSDFSQAKLLQRLGRGVDIGRFTQDKNYKRETILGLTMSVEDDIFDTAISLAVRYNISKWEMLMSHLEWLFTDSELSTKQLQDRVNDKQILTTLLEKPDQMVSRLKEYIYPAIDGKQLARLLYYYMLFHECVQNTTTTYEGDSDPQMHIRLIKKIKAAAPGVDYKVLMEGGDPLKAIQPHLIATNVHVFAKMANKLQTQDGIPVTASNIFKAFSVKIFWEGEKNASGKHVDWIHRYEVVHGFLDRLTNQDIIELIDSLTFSHKAIDTLTLDMRDDITRRALKFSRQMVGKQRKKSKDDILGSNVSNTELCEHFEQSLSHLASLNHDVLVQLEESEQGHHAEYSRLYNMSRSESDKIKDLCVRILCSGDSLKMVKDILDLANQQCVQGWKLKDMFQEALRVLLNDYSDPDQIPGHLPNELSSQDLIQCLLSNSRQDETSNVAINDECILEEIRPFCANETVSPEIKRDVLRLLQQFITLSGEDQIMLLFYQTNAVVSDCWDIQLTIDDVRSEEKRHELFVRLFNQNVAHKQMLSIASLLETWPPFQKVRENPWFAVFLKLVTEAQDGKTVIKIIQEKEKIIQLKRKDCDCLYEALLQSRDHSSAFKFALLAGDDEMFGVVVKQLNELQPDQFTCDEELLELFYKRRLSSRIVHTPFFAVYVTYILRGTLREGQSRANRVVNELYEAGYTVEAACMKISLDNMHPGLRSLDMAVGSFLKLITNR